MTRKNQRRTASTGGPGMIDWVDIMHVLTKTIGHPTKRLRNAAKRVRQGRLTHEQFRRMQHTPIVT